MATIHIDGKTYEVDGADNLLQACLSLGLDVPYFCWHPSLGSVGSCRQCAVTQYNDENDKRGRLVMSCMAPVQDNMWISVEDEEAKKFRASVVEWLMTNHPHDCPVCEEGGHCHLQDMTVMTGHNKRRYRFTKRTHQNQELGPFVAHEMNRCIACYRCVRYYKDYAGGTDLGVYGAHDNVYFGRVEDGVLESEFSGNLTEVCPTGVFTDKTHSERYNRKWDMQFAPSICHGCSTGCNISPGERYGELRRIENRFNGEVNQYFLCDRGRFGYGYVNRADRPRQVLLDGQALSIDTAFARLSDRLKARRLVGIGSPRASLESNHALKELVGAENFSTGLTQSEQELLELTLDILQNGPLPTSTLRDIEAHDAVFVLGEDLTQTAPRIALAVRQAAKGKATEIAASMKIQDWHALAVKNVAQNALYPVFIASTQETRLDDVADTLHAAPADLARFGFAVAHFIDNTAPAVTGLSNEVLAQAQSLALSLLAARRPLLVAGSSLGSRAILEATANIAKALKNREKAASISLVVPEANSLGLALLGGKPLESVLNDLSTADALFVLENDLYRRLEAQRVDEALSKISTLVVLDHQQTETLKKAQLVLPAATFAEADGTLVSQEGRAQRFFQVFDPTFYKPGDQVRESWRWLHGLSSALKGQAIDWTQLDHATEACAAAVPALAGIRDAAPKASFRIKGLKLAREPLRYSGRTAMRAKINIHEPRIPQDQDTAFAFSMEGYSGTQELRQQIPFAWAPGWNSPSAWNKFQDEVGGHLRAGDPGVRLIEPSGADSHWFSVCAAYQPEAGRFISVPVHHIFGSGEMSALTPVMQSRIPAPYAVVSSEDAERLGLKDGAQVQLRSDTQSLTVTLNLSTQLQPGLIGLPVGISAIPVKAGLVIDAIEECVQ